MSQNTKGLSIKEAQEDVKQSNQDLENAVGQFKDTVEGGIRSLERYLKAAKNPVVMVGIVFSVGVFFGQVIRYSFRNRI